jgi:hypothetical protein
MGILNINAANISDMTNRVANVEIPARETDGALDQEETEYQNTYWSKWYGMYLKVPELKKAIDMKAIWTVGRGFKADPETTVILNNITGWGNDTFNMILKNMIITRQIGGDAFAEIIRDPESGEIVNLKPLDPGSIKIIVDKKGIIIRYEQVSKAKKNTPPIKFKPSEIFHLTKDRVADNIHGQSIIEAVEDIINARNEAMTDMKKVMHRYVKPMRHFKLATDDQAKIDQFIRTVDSMNSKGEDLYTPQGTVEFELLAVPANSTLNPLPWINDLKNYFYQAVGIPQIILGSSGEFTEATAKIAYLAFQQSVEDEQMDIESQMWEQLQLRIELEFPASLENELLSDQKKDGTNNLQGGAFQPNELTAGVGE